MICDGNETSGAMENIRRGGDSLDGGLCGCSRLDYLRMAEMKIDLLVRKCRDCPMRVRIYVHISSVHWMEKETGFSFFQKDG